MPQPNVLWIFTDDQEIDAIESQSMPYLVTQPHGSWVILPNAVLSTPLCGPARANALTGRRWQGTGVKGNTFTDRVNEANTINVALQTAGYRTGMIGKYLNHYDDNSVPPGWDRFYAIQGGEASYFYNYTATDYTTPGPATEFVAGSSETNPEDYFTDVITAHAVDFIEAGVSDTRPWFLYFPTTAPHSPATPAPRHTSATITVSDPSMWNTRPTGCPQWLTDQPLMTAGEEATTRTARVNSRRTLLALDEGIEAIFDALVSTGQLADTIVIYMTDNGHSKGRNGIGQNNVNLQKRSPYRYAIDPSLRIRYPGVTGRTDTRFVGSSDIAATILAQAGATPIQPVDGIDITTLLDNTATSWRESIEACYSGVDETVIPAWWALRSGDWKYAEWSTGEIELYDWATDPDESTNVAAANPSVVEELSGKLDALKRDPNGRFPGSGPRVAGVEMVTEDGVSDVQSFTQVPGEGLTAMTFLV